MQDAAPDDTDASNTFSRRGFVQAMGVAGGALAGLGAVSGRAAAASRSTRTIMAGTEHETTLHHYDSGVQGPTTLVIGGMHGDERSGYNAASEIASWAVDAGELYVIPALNAVGVERWDRECDHGDLNRSFPPTGGVCDTWVAEAVWETVLEVDPDWTFDLHASFGLYDEGTGVGQAMFPTETAPARAYGEETVASLNQQFGLSGDRQYTVGNTLDADRSMLVHRITGVLDRPGFICESYRGDGTPLADQVAWHAFCVERTMFQYGQGVTRNPTDATSSGSTGASSTGGGAPTWEAWPITVDDPWQRYDLHFEYAEPVVIAKSLSAAGGDPCHARLRDVTGSSFDCRVEEWDYLNGIHYPEETGMWTVEAGVHTYDDGTRVQAGHVETDESWAGVAFEHEFAEPPVVFAQTQTTNGPNAVVTRVADVDADGFQLRLQEAEPSNGHRNERVGYVAIEQGSGTLGPKPYEARVVDVDDGWTDVAFDGTYADPVFLCGVQSFAGSNPCAARVRAHGSDGATVRVEEEQGVDEETTHVAERVGYLVMED